MRRNSCRLCSGHGKHHPVGQCADCGAPFCGRHGGWVEDRWLCAKCARLEATDS